MPSQDCNQVVAGKAQHPGGLLVRPAACFDGLLYFNRDLRFGEHLIGIWKPYIGVDIDRTFFKLDPVDNSLFHGEFLGLSLGQFE